MMPLLLRLHRWTTLVFSVPLAVLIVTGLVLALEPIVQDIGARGLKLTSRDVAALLERHDPEGKARGLAIRAYENRMTLQGVGEDGSLDIDLASRAVADDSETTMLSDIFGQMRGLHEHFVLDLDWLVTASSFAMVALIAIGVLMGWPRLRNTFSGWHQGMAWVLLPVLALSPVTGLMLAYRVSLGAGGPLERAPAPPLKVAFEMLGTALEARGGDFNGVLWLRNRGGRLLARVSEGGGFNVYQISDKGVTLTPNNWPRGLHEGNVFGLWTGIMVLVTALAFVGVMATGLTIWFGRRFLRRRNRTRERVPAASPAE